MQEFNMGEKKGRHIQQNINTKLVGQNGKGSVDNKKLGANDRIPNQNYKGGKIHLDSDGCYYNEKNKFNAHVVAADVLAQDPFAIDHLRAGGNILYIPVSELNILKSLQDKYEIGEDAMEAVAKIEALQQSGAKDLVVFDEYNWSIINGLENKNGDCNVIAAASVVLSKFREKFKRVKLISLNPSIRLYARLKEPLLKVEDYMEAHVYLSAKNVNLQEINIKQADDRIVYNNESFYYQFAYNKLRHGTVAEDESVICWSDWSLDQVDSNSENDWRPRFVATRCDQSMIITLPKDGVLFGLKPYVKGQGYNWEQLAAIHKLLDKAGRYDIFFIAGAAGSGKSLLGMAAGLERRKQFDQIIVIVSMIHAGGGEDKIGFLPGSLEKKLEVWQNVTADCLKKLEKYAVAYGLKPTADNDDNGAEQEAENTKKNRKAAKRKVKEPGVNNFNSNVNSDGADKIVKSGWLFKKLSQDGTLVFMPMDYLRGRTFTNTLIIIEDAQNLSRRDVKLINTRAGEGTVIIYNGDVGQVDKVVRQYGVTRVKNGFANAWLKLNRRGTARISLVKTVRSKLAEDSEKMI